MTASSSEASGPAPVTWRWCVLVFVLTLTGLRCHWVLNEVFLGQHLFQEWWNLMRLAKILVYGLTAPLLLAAAAAAARRPVLRRLTAAAVLVHGLAGLLIVNYFEYYGTLFPLQRLADAPQLLAIRQQLFLQVLGPADYLALAATSLATRLTWRGLGVPPAFRVPHRAALAALTAYAVLLGAQVLRHGSPAARLNSHGAVMTASHYGFLVAYAASLTAPAPAPAGHILPHPGTVNAGRLVPAPGPHLDRPNIIVVQVESLDAATMDTEVNGRLVMPFLNRYAASCLRADLALSAHGGGGSSDAELTVLLSLLPLMRHSGFLAARYDQLDSLPGVLAAAGYRTVILHPNDGHFYNRAAAYRRLPLEAFYDAHAFTGPASGWYARDADFLQQSLPYLRQQTQPFLAYCITMQSHGPFRNHAAPNGDPQALDTRGLSRLAQHHALTFHEVDRALETFITALPRTLGTDNNLVVIFGDHASGVLAPDPSGLETIALLMHHPALPPRTIRQPVSPLDIAPTLTDLLGLAPGATWLGDSLLESGPRRVARPNRSMISLDPATGEPRITRGAARVYMDYSKSLLTGGGTP